MKIKKYFLIMRNTKKIEKYIWFPIFFYYEKFKILLWEI